LKAVVIRRAVRLHLVALGKIQAILTEVYEGQSSLRRLSEKEMPLAPRGSIFVGAGDSYAAGMAGFYASGGRCIALDPYTMAGAPEVAEGVEVFFISVSGRTVSNVAAAKRVARTAKRTTAITADPASPLGKVTQRVLRLPMEYVPKTPGMLAFSLSLLAVMKLAGEGGRCDFQRVFRGARRDRQSISSDAGTTYFLGNGLAHAVALYAAAKDYELLGSKAHAELLEEFSHMELFSLRKKDLVNIFSSFDPSEMAPRLAEALKTAGYQARVVPSQGRTKIAQLFHDVFVVQLAVIDRAAAAGLSEPRFLSSGGKLRASDSMIY
jgi:fructoselysine-6-P-deglycase FrlB-like protein